ncbi:histidine kinase, partial [Streptosporangium algeriense]
MVVLIPVLVASSGEFLAAVPAVASMSASVLPWPIGRVRIAAVAVFLATLSIFLDFAYFGRPQAALLWLPIEVLGLTIVLGRVVREVPGHRVLLVAGVTGLAAFAAPVRFTLRTSSLDGELLFAAVFMLTFAVALAAGVGFYLRSLDNQRRRAVAEARRDQRLELARDLHDFVAHEMTGILLEVQAARVREYDPVENGALLARLEEAGQRALNSMDETLRVMRGSDGSSGGSYDGFSEGSSEGFPEGSSETREQEPLRPHGLGELPGLMRRFRETVTAHTELDLEEDLADVLPRQTQRAIFHVVLEGLTNIRKHAGKATKVQVTVGRTPDGRVEATVTDNGGRTTLLRGERRGGGAGLPRHPRQPRPRRPAVQTAGRHSAGHRTGRRTAGHAVHRGDPGASRRPLPPAGWRQPGHAPLPPDPVGRRRLEPRAVHRAGTPALGAAFGLLQRVRPGGGRSRVRRFGHRPPGRRGPAGEPVPQVGPAGAHPGAPYALPPAGDHPSVRRAAAGRHGRR